MDLWAFLLECFPFGFDMTIAGNWISTRATLHCPTLAEVQCDRGKLDDLAFGREQRRVRIEHNGGNPTNQRKRIVSPITLWELSESIEATAASRRSPEGH
jgi:hypothetical protein